LYFKCDESIDDMEPKVTSDLHKLLMTFQLPQPNQRLLYVFLGKPHFPHYFTLFCFAGPSFRDENLSQKIFNSPNQISRLEKLSP